MTLNESKAVTAHEINNMIMPKLKKLLFNNLPRIYGVLDLDVPTWEADDIADQGIDLAHHCNLSRILASYGSIL